MRCLLLPLEGGRAPPRLSFLGLLANAKQANKRTLPRQPTDDGQKLGKYAKYSLSLVGPKW